MDFMLLRRSNGTSNIGQFDSAKPCPTRHQFIEVELGDNYSFSRLYLVKMELLEIKY